MSHLVLQFGDVQLVVTASVAIEPSAVIPVVAQQLSPLLHAIRHHQIGIRVLCILSVVTDLGLGYMQFEADSHWSHCLHPWPRCQRQTPIHVLLC